MSEQFATTMFMRKDGKTYQVITFVDPDSEQSDFGVRSIVREVS